MIIPDFSYIFNILFPLLIWVYSYILSFQLHITVILILTNSYKPMSIQRVHSFKKPTALSYFQRFQNNLLELKEEVEVFNKWENNSLAINMLHSNNSTNKKKKLLKEMTAPKYHKAVVNIIQARQKTITGLLKKNSSKTFNSLAYVNMKAGRKQQMVEKQISLTQPFGQNFSTQLSRTERLKSKQLKRNIKKKQKLLSQEWDKLADYRSQNNICNSERSFGRNKHEKVIIRKVMKNHQQNHSIDDSEYFSRNQTFQSEYLDFK